MAGADLVFEPVAGVVIAVAEEDGAWVYLADKVQELIAVGVGGEVEFLDLAFAGGGAAAGAEEKCFALFGRTKAAGGGVGIGVADEENGHAIVTHHAQGEVVRGGVFAHHAGGDDEQSSAAEVHGLGLAFFEDGQFQRFVQLQVGLLAIGAVGFEVVNFGEDAAKAADENLLALQFAFAHEQREQRENFLGAAQREGGNEHGTFAFEDALDALAEALDFSFARETGGHAAAAAR